MHQLKVLYSRTSVIWTPKGRTKSVHNSEVSTLVKLDVAMGHRLHTIVPFPNSHKCLSFTCGKSVHRDGVSIKRRVSTRWGSSVINL